MGVAARAVPAARAGFQALDEKRRQRRPRSDEFGILLLLARALRVHGADERPGQPAPSGRRVLPPGLGPPAQVVGGARDDERAEQEHAGAQRPREAVVVREGANATAYAA